MTASTPDPDEPGTLTSREQAILAEIAAELSADGRLAGDMGRRLPPIVRVWAGPVALLVVAMVALAGVMVLVPALSVVEAAMLTVGVVVPWVAWCSITLGRPRP